MNTRGQNIIKFKDKFTGRVNRSRFDLRAINGDQSTEDRLPLSRESMFYRQTTICSLLYNASSVLSPFEETTANHRTSIVCSALSTPNQFWGACQVQCDFIMINVSTSFDYINHRIITPNISY